jgi:hypothetical protein
MDICKTNKETFVKVKTFSFINGRQYIVILNFLELERTPNTHKRPRGYQSI